MQANRLADAGILTMDTVREMAPSAGPWVSILMPTFRGGERIRENPIRFKKLIHEVEAQLDAREMKREDRDHLVEPLLSLGGYFDPNSGEEPQGDSLAVFRSSSDLRLYWLPQVIEEEKAVVSKHIYVKPLLAELGVDRSFYLLALSQNRIRLLKCTDRTSEEVALPDYIPTNLMDFRQTRKPDHTLDNMATAGPGTGSMKGVMFGTGAEKERKDEILYHFYNRVDLGLQQFLRDDPKPLVIAGVEYELPIYRGISEYPNLVAGGVRGAPDGFKGGEMHARALELMKVVWQQPVENALALWEKFGGDARANSNFREVVQCAFNGRVSHLFLAHNAEHHGDYIAATNDVLSHKEPVAGDEDLINAAAVETLLHSGEVFPLPRNKVPRGGQLAALLRY